MFLHINGRQRAPYNRAIFPFARRSCSLDGAARFSFSCVSASALRNRCARGNSDKRSLPFSFPVFRQKYLFPALKILPHSEKRKSGKEKGEKVKKAV
jgi:hypothetical protein